jgi:Predicted exporters of the RND superfamily
MVPWFRFILRHKAGVAVVLALITAVAAWSTSRGVLSSSLQQLFFGESEAYASYIVEAQRFGSDEAIVVGYETDDPLSPAQLDQLEAAVAAMEEIPEIAAVHSLLGAARVQGESGMLTIETWADLAREQPDRSRALAAAAAADPRTGGLFIDRTGRVGAAVVAELTIDPHRSGEQVPGIRDAVEQSMVDAGFAADGLHLAGLPVVVGGLIDQSRRNLVVLFPITCVVLGVSVVALFGRLAPALVSLGVL